MRAWILLILLSSSWTAKAADNAPEPTGAQAWSKASLTDQRREDARKLAADLLSDVQSDAHPTAPPRPKDQSESGK